jgi:hypothetical protein
MDSAWGATQSLSSAAQLGLTLLLLGSVSPWLLLLLAFAAAPLWFDQRGRLGVARAETDSAEEFRLQRHLFEMATSAAAGKEIRVTGSAAAPAARQAAAWDSAIARRARAQVVAALWRTLGWLVFADLLVRSFVHLPREVTARRVRRHGPLAGRLRGRHRRRVWIGQDHAGETAVQVLPAVFRSHPHRRR